MKHFEKTQRLSEIFNKCAIHTYSKKKINTCVLLMCQLIPNYYKLGLSEGKDEEAKEAMIKALQKLEDELTARAGKFFGGGFMLHIFNILYSLTPAKSSCA